jgi:hypothetical protein
VLAEISEKDEPEVKEDESLADKRSHFGYQKY